MTEMKNFQISEVAQNLFPGREGSTGYVRIQGEIDGRLYAAFVPQTVAEDEPAAKSYLTSFADSAKRYETSVVERDE
jgi:hypothetical protein